ncbi:hypothetical protein [Sphaerisporangium aureirubrum]|uniref:DUF2637 domain-containing protein n=1 Tax=Sphaerisporangium aureirubrum TaxID=1544736 RepID=A0ABW1NTB4_9ACTN
MQNIGAYITTFFAAIPTEVWQTIAAAATVVFLVVALRLLPRAWRATRRLLATRPAEDHLTVIAACIATGVSAQGMWRFTGDVLGFDGPLQLLLFSFIEVAVITSAVRARRNMRENFSAGIDGIAVWVLTSLTAVLSALDARSMAEAIFRLAAPLVAAWLWERGMAIERHRISGRARIRWRMTPERVLVWLGLADASDRTAGEIDTQRRLTRVTLAARTLRALRDMGASDRKVRRAQARLERLAAAAHTHTGLARDPELQRRVAAETAALRSVPALADVEPHSEWAPAAPQRSTSAEAGADDDVAGRPYGLTVRDGHVNGTRTAPAWPKVTPYGFAHRTAAMPYGPYGTSAFAGARTGAVFHLPPPRSAEAPVIDQAALTSQIQDGVTEAVQSLGADLLQALRELPVRPDSRTEDDRTARTPRAPAKPAAMSRTAFLAHVRDQILRAAERGDRWDADYPSLTALARRPLTWVEDAVRTAQRGVLGQPEHVRPSPRTGPRPQGRTDADPYADADEVQEGHAAGASRTGYGSERGSQDRTSHTGDAGRTEDDPAGSHVTDDRFRADGCEEHAAAPRTGSCTGCARIFRAAFVDELRRQISRGVWRDRPPYGYLKRLSGRSQSWLEKAVREARLNATA